MWTVIYVSQSSQTAQKLIDTFYANGIISKLRRVTGDDEKSCCEILVPGTEMEAAQDLIIENGLF